MVRVIWIVRVVQAKDVCIGRKGMEDWSSASSCAPLLRYSARGESGRARVTSRSSCLYRLIFVLLARWGWMLILCAVLYCLLCYFNCCLYYQQFPCFFFSQQHIFLWLLCDRDKLFILFVLPVQFCFLEKRIDSLWKGREEEGSNCEVISPQCGCAWFLFCSSMHIIFPVQAYDCFWFHYSYDSRLCFVALFAGFCEAKCSTFRMLGDRPRNSKLRLQYLFVS